MYYSNPVSQIDHTAYQNLNCVAATASMLADTSSLGFWNVTPARIRSLSGDTSGGITYTAASNAVQNATGGDVNLQILYWAPQNANRSTLDDLLEAPRSVGIVIHCAYTVNTPFRTGWFAGTHSVVVVAKRHRNGVKQALVMDPGRSDPKAVWWPWALLIKAAKGAAGGDFIHVLYTRDMDDVKRVAKKNGAIRSAPRQDAPRVSTITAGNVYTVYGTVRGGQWEVPYHQGRGWSKLGVNKFAHGGRIR